MCNSAQYRNWLTGNRGKRNATLARYRASKRAAAVPLTIDERLAIKSLYDEAQRLTALTGEVYHVDHIYPLCLGGKHHPSNLRVISARENQSKGGRITPDVLEYLQLMNNLGASQNESAV